MAKKWEFIEIDWQKYYETYKELWTTSVLNGYGIPVLLDYEVPPEYDFKIGEKEKIINKVSEENHEKLRIAGGNIRKLEIDYVNGDVSDKEIKEFLLNELEEFLKAFPQFNELIIKWNDEIIDAI